MEVAAQLRALIVPLARLLRQQSGDGLTPTQASALGTVLRHGPLSLSDLAATERLSLPMISKVVGSLETEGLIRRAVDPSDRRICLVEFNADRQEWLSDNRQRRDLWLAEKLAAMDDDDAAAITGAVPALRLLLDDSQ